MNTLSVSLFVVRFTPCVLLDESTVDSVVTVICLKDDSLVASGSPELVGAGNPVVELVHLGGWRFKCWGRARGSRDRPASGEGSVDLEPVD